MNPAEFDRLQSAVVHTGIKKRLQPTVLMQSEAFGNTVSVLKLTAKTLHMRSTVSLRVHRLKKYNSCEIYTVSSICIPSTVHPG